MFPSGVGGEQNRAKRRMNIGLTFLRWTEMQVQMNADVLPRLLTCSHQLYEVITSQCCVCSTVKVAKKLIVSLTLN